MGKNFTEWNQFKTSLEQEDSKTFFHEREIWLASLGLNLGHEQDGKGDKFLRPILVLKKFNQAIFWGLPLKHTNKISPYYHPITINNDNSFVLLSQLRLIDKKRLFHKIATIHNNELEDIKWKMVGLLAS